jgi:glycosyltransferase involved in cell wall biosynthesis
MDSALEWLNDLKSNYEVHLLVELSPDSLKSTVIDIDNRNIKSDFGDLDEVIDTETKTLLNPYFMGLHSVKYIYYPTKQMLSIKNLKMTYKVLSYIKKNNINTLHFDTTSGRFMPALPFLFRIKKIATIHDPNPHTGEESFKKTVIRKVYTSMVNNYLFYSRYSYRQFIQNHIHLHTNTFTAQLKPYSYISKLNTRSIEANKYILYFGRVSYYKGIDLLLEAFHSVVSQYPTINLVIAGKGSIEYVPFDDTRNSHIRFINKYVSIRELAELINNAEFIVCPYREASQSGVLMTAFALNKPVLATNVGAFPEYIVENVNGMLVDPSMKGIKNGMLNMLNDNYYKKLEADMNSSIPKRLVNNANVFTDLYGN